MAVIIPAVDILDGKCVRLKQGNRQEETVYGVDAAAVARRFADEGARRLHLVDLGGAFGATGQGGLGVLREVVLRTGLPVQFGGGLRTVDRLQEALAAGARWVIAGTAALTDKAFLPRAADALGGLEQLILAVDMRDGHPVVSGWQAQAGSELPAVLDMAKEAGVGTLMVTDTGADGTMRGVQAGVFEPFVGLGFRIIAGGGIASLDDVRLLAGGSLAPEGIVIGSALLKGAFTLAEAHRAADDAAAGLPAGGRRA